MTDRPSGQDENSVTCPTCGAKTLIDEKAEKQAQEHGYVLCPKGHKIEMMSGLM